jgi:dTMP kinase
MQKTELSPPCGRGRLISLEGGEGAGKTTALRGIQAVLDEAGIDYLVTREPGGTAEAEAIRQILLEAPHLEPLTELLLMFASRREHVKKVIEPALKAGRWVVTDRYVDASYAYQGGGRGIDTALIETLDQAVVGSLQADLTFLLDIDPALGHRRISGRSHADRIEQEQRDFFERVRAAYLQRARLQPQRFCVIDASQPLPAVRQLIEKVLTDFIRTAKHGPVNSHNDRKR